MRFEIARLKYDCVHFIGPLFNEQILLREAPIYIVFPGWGGAGEGGGDWELFALAWNRSCIVMSSSM